MIRATCGQIPGVNRLRHDEKRRVPPSSNVSNASLAAIRAPQSGQRENSLEDQNQRFFLPLVIYSLSFLIYKEIILGQIFCTVHKVDNSLDPKGIPLFVVCSTNKIFFLSSTSSLFSKSLSVLQDSFHDSYLIYFANLLLFGLCPCQSVHRQLCGENYSLDSGGEQIATKSG